MKKKILIGLTTGLFVVVMIFNLKMSTQNSDNILLRNIAALSTANAEGTGGGGTCSRYYHGDYCGYVEILHPYSNYSVYYMYY